VIFHPFAKAFFSGDLGGAFNLWQTYDADLHGGIYDRNIFSGRYFTDTPTKFSAGMPSPASSTEGGVVEASLDPQGEFLWIARTSGLVEVWRTRGMKKIAQVQAHKSLIYDLAVDDKDGSVFTVGRDGDIMHWRLTEAHLDPISLAMTGEIVQIGRTSSLGSQLLVIVDHSLFRASESGSIYPVPVNAFYRTEVASQ
jgi:WD40 repeat protein